MSLVVIAVATFGATKAYSYIPSVPYILEKVAKNQGRGFYVIDQDVTFQLDNERVVLNEKWIVENANNMHLTVKGNGYQFSSLYKDVTKYFIDESGARKSAPITVEFFEPVFHYRIAASLGRYLV